MVCAVVFAGVEVETDVGKAIKFFISFLRYHYNNVIDTTDFSSEKFGPNRFLDI